jgi:putative phosphoesterase
VRLAILADTHMPKGSRELPPRCLEELAAADLIVHLGDFSSISVLERLESLGPPVAAVHGNVDDAQVRRRLPAERELELERVRIALVHDAGPRRGRLARLRGRFPNADAVLFGHSHLPLHEREGGFQIFNPGSPTERRRAPTRTMGIGDVRDGVLDLRLIELSAAIA